MKIIVIRFLKSKLFIAAVFFFGIAASLFLHKIKNFQDKTIVNFQLKRLFLTDGHLVNPLIGVENPEGGDAKLEGIKYSIGEYIRRCKENGDVSEVSVYMEDLNRGTWIGLDEDNNFAAASLLKLPLMIAYLKMAEQDQAILNQEIKYGQALNLPPQNILPENCAQSGNTYTVDQLLRYMIVHSDNISKELLWGNLDHKFIAREKWGQIYFSIA